MRLGEIEDNNNIDRLLTKYFDFENYELSNGGVIIHGPTNLILSPPNGKLPINFNEARKDFNIGSGNLITLKGCPRIISGEFSCSHNRLTSLVGGPEEVYGDYRCTGTNFISLDGLPKIINGYITLHFNDNLPLLKLLFIKELTMIVMLGINISELTNILNKYIRQGRKGAIQCAAELTRAGYKGNARL